MAGNGPQVNDTLSRRDHETECEETLLNDHSLVLSDLINECCSQANAIKSEIFKAIEQKSEAIAAQPDCDHTACGDQTRCSSDGERKQQLENAIKEKITDLETSLLSLNLSNKHGSTSDLKQTVLESDSPLDDAECKEKPYDSESNVVKDVCVDNQTNGESNQSPKRSESNKKAAKCSNTGAKASKKVAKTLNSRKGEQKEKCSIDHLMKSLSNSCETDGEKLDVLCKKYVELWTENKTLELRSKQHEKICLQLMKEKEQLQSEHNRVVLAKSKLESLCRELQRHNKAVKEETLMKIKEEEEKHREVANKFQGTLSDIMTLVQENQQRSDFLREENKDLATKMKALMEHYEKWEKNIEKILHQKDLELQIMRGKLAKSNYLLNEEKEHFLTEKQNLVGLIADLQKRYADASAKEMQSKAELSMYTSKYEEFQNVLTKSNEMFVTFKRDMEKMAKQIKKLEKETIQWKNKWESCNRALGTLSEEKQKRDNECEVALQKIQTLEKLCRALQEERFQMQTKLKELERKQSTVVENDVSS